MAEVIHKHVRMNDYVGAGIYATLTWPGPCTREGGSHVLGLLGPSCVVCKAKPKVEYEKSEQEERLAKYRAQVREVFGGMSDQGLAFQDGVVVGGIDREELDREINRRRAERLDAASQAEHARTVADNEA